MPVFFFFFFFFFLQLFHRIDAFVQYKRHLVDVSNQMEFCQRGSSGNDSKITNIATANESLINMYGLHVSCREGEGEGGEGGRIERAVPCPLVVVIICDCTKHLTAITYLYIIHVDV